MFFDSLQDWLLWQESFHPRSIDLGLERVSRVYVELNSEIKKIPTITVAGTNGKGSCVAFLEAIYRAQGYRVGAYTSPHILKYNERIKISGQSVSDAVVCEAFARIEAVRNGISLSYFEFGTLAALDIFQRAEVDVQLLEVGLGGRLDAVNIVDPNVAIVTSICIDHADWLGETREAIAHEKAGIFRRNVLAVIGDSQPPEALRRCAEKVGTPLWFLGNEFSYQKYADHWDWFGEKRRLSKLPGPALKGEHQYRNASAVLAAVLNMQDLLPVSDASIRQGLENTHLMGRFQLIDGEIPILLDVAHNPQAVRNLVEYLHLEFPGQRKHAIFSMMCDKDISGVVDIMKPEIDNWFITPLENPRSTAEKVMREIFSQSAVSNARFGFAGFAETFAAAQNIAEPGDLILLFGSFFLVSEYLAHIGR